MSLTATGRPVDAARHISLLNTPAEQVELLARACHAAHFGLNKRDGYEAAFHTAEKLTLDVDHFAAKFDVQRCGILARVKNDLLGRHNITKSVECELYKLNVFREGDSWRTYNGTPGSAKMFGSLVIVFPIPHTGGKFILRHGGKEWSFETGKELAATARPSVGYVAFRNDVEHVMGPVLSGHRVTLTYNLYFGNRYNTAQTGLPKSKSIRQQEKEFKKGMEQLLADPYSSFRTAAALVSACSTNIH
ncbi:uncharacterized protein LOC129600273 [Paramacrobiotus metropolitanus]|uniref:uncharacterized protein LOC129600273 n=1 Tax=Paramacrobiotus metropolitanus TaxID=2943436 RepID=UPI002445627E|nr:uncharacterized protein LOC129600273 [Paramacrobiotus metropolitanus]